MRYKQLKQIFWLFFITACSVNKFIPEDETLYTGANFEFDTETKIKDLDEVETTLQRVLYPKPNTSKIGLHAHYKVARDSAGFPYKFINKKIGEEPVYLSDVDRDKTEELIVNRLENSGFFYSSVRDSLESTEHKSELTYKVSLRAPYTQETFQLDTDTLPIYQEIKKSLDKTILEKGDRFDLSKLKLERQRIDTKLKSIGYYNFNADFLIFEIDTNQYQTKKFDLYLRLKKDVPHKALIPYKLDSVIVDTRYTVRRRPRDKDTVAIKNVYFLQDSLFFKAEKLRPFLLVENGQRYNPRKFELTSKRLSSIGTYKYANTQFEEQAVSETDSVGHLNALIDLSPNRKRSLSAELQANTKSSGFTGPSLSFNYLNRNLFKGGEFLKLTGELGYETQTGSSTNGTSAGLNSIVLGLSGSLVYPKLLLFPMNITEQFEYGVPNTTISAGVEYLNRSQLYSIGTFNASFGYQLNANRYVYHNVKPINTSYVRLANSSPEFEEILEENEFLQSSFEQQLISGLLYNFTYTELNDSRKKTPFFFSSNLELVGNSLSLLTQNENENGKKTIFGVEFAQFAKIDADIRNYFKFSNEKVLVTRLYGGVGLTYGNSDVLPFSRQFFSGGPYSVRAFQIRSIGPGTYVDNSDDDSTASFFDSSGDIKLEANIEYRFPLWSYLKGAFFVDAGNVWLLNDSEDFPEGKFDNNFMNELAIGAGFGVRVDIQSFVIRLDWAAPIHSPEETDANYNFDIGNGIFNFAIGYPF